MAAQASRREAVAEGRERQVVQPERRLGEEVGPGQAERRPLVDRRSGEIGWREEKGGEKGDLEREIRGFGEVVAERVGEGGGRAGRRLERLEEEVRWEEERVAADHGRGGGDLAQDPVGGRVGDGGRPVHLEALPDQTRGTVGRGRSSKMVGQAVQRQIGILLAREIERFVDG